MKMDYLTMTIRKQKNIALIAHDQEETGADTVVRGA